MDALRQGTNGPITNASTVAVENSGLLAWMPALSVAAFVRDPDGHKFEAKLQP